MGRSTDQLAEEIRQYLEARPTASDTAHGIARFWVSSTETAARRALTLLVAMGHVEERETAGAVRFVRAAADEIIESESKR